jgi:hypothetical protein
VLGKLSTTWYTLPASFYFILISLYCHVLKSKIMLLKSVINAMLCIYHFKYYCFHLWNLILSIFMSNTFNFPWDLLLCNYCFSFKHTISESQWIFVFFNRNNNKNPLFPLNKSGIPNSSNHFQNKTKQYSQIKFVWSR